LTAPLLAGKLMSLGSTVGLEFPKPMFVLEMSSLKTFGRLRAAGFTLGSFFVISTDFSDSEDSIEGLMTD
jgi:hypothetical protein